MQWSYSHIYGITRHKPIQSQSQDMMIEPELPEVQPSHLRGHDELMVDNMVRGEPHPKEGTGGVEVAGHPSAAVDILTNTLQRRRVEAREVIHEIVDCSDCGASLKQQTYNRQKQRLQNWPVWERDCI